MGLIPENKRIVIDADGNISVVKELQQAVDDVNTKGDVKLQVGAEGDISVLDTADEKLKELVKNDTKFRLNLMSIQAVLILTI